MSVVENVGVSVILVVENITDWSTIASCRKIWLSDEKCECTLVLIVVVNLPARVVIVVETYDCKVCDVKNIIVSWQL